ncbi:MAG: hypothetical protein IAF58_13085 [Leptolyngbya sp.]|nr:hypothetical protein [Candidatus Melainabacteria bacterium]
MSDEDKVKISPSYPISQLMKAILGKSENAQKKIEQWSQVIAGLLNGTIQVGAREPVSETPGWVTLEVVHGGFATGSFAANGPLLPHELESLRVLQIPIDSEDGNAISIARSALNLHFSKIDETSELKKLLDTGCFRVHIPEEGALLVLAWLLNNGERERADKLIETLAPFFDKLRFYPEAHSRRLRENSGVFISSAGETARNLRKKSPQASVQKMNESIQVWTPLYDRIVRLFLQTVDGAIPQFSINADGSLVRSESGQPVVSGGWPCRNYSPDWSTQAKKILDDYSMTAKKNSLCKKHLKRKENFAQLRAYAEKIVRDPKSLSGQDVGIIRKILASYVTAHGAPDSDLWRQVRQSQNLLALQPQHHTLSKILAERLKDEPDDEGVPNVLELLGPLNEVEALNSGLTAGTEMPTSVTKKAKRCLESSLEVLVDSQLVNSSEVLATLLPVLTANVKISSIEDKSLAHVYSQVYRAFKRRRSLLLLNYESQIRFDELPWVSAVEPWVNGKEKTREAAQEVLLKATRIALLAYPETIFPNKLIVELKALSASAGITVPLVKELAADIFMGGFSSSFIHAAWESANLLSGTLYERYYAIDYGAVLAIEDLTDVASGAKTSEQFAKLCVDLAGSDKMDKNDYSTARNGAIIEQAQILTTHNLASLTNALNLKVVMQDDFIPLAQSCFKWICRKQQMRMTDGRAILHLRKNCAYAWRQMIFFLSMTPETEQAKFFVWADEHFEKQREDFRQRFAPILFDLKAKASVTTISAVSMQAETISLPRRFLGWSDMYTPRS